MLQVVWEENSVTWYGDGNKKLIKLTRVGGDPSIWPLQPLHARIGTWAGEAGREERVSEMATLRYTTLQSDSHIHSSLPSK